MKKIFSVSLFLSFFCTTCAYAQQSGNDSLIMLLSKVKEDTTRVDLLLQLGGSYVLSDPDSAYLFLQEGHKLAQAIGYTNGEMNCKETLAFFWWSVGDYATGIKLLLQVLSFAHSKNDTSYQAEIYSGLANLHRDQGDYNEALLYTKKYEQLTNTKDSLQIGATYYEMNKPDSALVYFKGAESKGYNWPILFLARIHSKLNHDSLAFHYYHRGIKEFSVIRQWKRLAGSYNGIAELFKKIGRTDSALYYATQALGIAQKKKFNKEILQSYLLLSDLYSKTDAAKAFNYLHLAIASKDSLYNQDKQRQILSYKFNEELQQRETEKLHAEYKNQIRMYILLVILVVVVVIGVILWRYNQQRKKAYAKLEGQKKETDQQRAKAEQALAELKSTQAQLIQSEKMASLGELTAGIAHEIQNPLNFVNNFSEVNKELIEELKIKNEKLKIEDDEVSVLLSDLAANEDKINHHGKRADAIVKGMLQHSRVSAGQKEPTDINALADEYLRLAYHGMRAKDKTFNAEIKTDFDTTIRKINIVPQDMGRVLLNLYNNAFYAVNEKKKAYQAELIKAGEDYAPIVSIITKRTNNNVVISVSDNGKGIPQNIVDKIFQPFFTTKPTGEGTGLGLSLGYDIIKAHGGEIKVETNVDEENPNAFGKKEGSTFIIRLPVV
jgi:two-component system NtrC family sensor kinase